MAERDRTTVRERWPDVWAQLEASAPVTLIEDRATLIVDGLHLTSAVDRTAEAELQAGRVPPGVEEAVVYGLALGDLPRALLARPGLWRLHVVVLAPAVAAATLGRVDYEWLGDRRVTVSVASPADRPRAPWAVAPACLRLACDRAARLRDLLELELAAPYQARRYAERESMVQRAIADNARRMRADGDAATLFDSRPGATICVAAGGPTLADAFGWLRRERADVTLVAVSTAIGPLHAAGIVPDVAVVVDPKPEQIDHFRHLEDEPLRETPLVWVPAVQPAVLDRWPGPRLLAYLDQPRYAALRRELPRGVLFCAGTVTHAAADLAVKMGAARVVLLGADFSYPRERSHVVGAAQERGGPEGPRTWVVDGRGGRVGSDLTLVGYLRDLEDHIARHAGVRWMVGSADGARIEGTTLVPEAT